jgi:hypothetical protein
MQTHANALYLQKTTPDTASAIETFAGGILIDTINSITAGSNMTIASNHTGEDLFLGQNNSQHLYWCGRINYTTKWNDTYRRWK